MAIGGGEPTMHPDFCNILEDVRSLGTVPNYTTAGHHMTPEIYEATNKYCGGVAMTFHAARGIDWFIEHYKKLKDNLNVQLNVHLIVDVHAAENMLKLIEAQKVLGRLNVVLLAYYPDVGRAKEEYALTRKVYTVDFPKAIKLAQEAKMGIAYSEGMLPYFFSRPELGINTSFATYSEGHFSCYINPEGKMSRSSFSHKYQIRGAREDRHEGKADSFAFDSAEWSIYEKSAQVLWQCMSPDFNVSYTGVCEDCNHKMDCAAPHQFHLQACAHQTHNKKLPILEEWK